MSNPSYTRGFGMLEGFLARRRAAVANRLIPDAYRTGRILDIGCGAYPYFLARTVFAEKIGVDKAVTMVEVPADGEIAPAIRLLAVDVEHDSTLGLVDECVDVVTMLAVFEHIEPTRLVALLDEVERVLKPGGMCILTTPSGWTGPILTTLKWLRLVSRIEIDEHEDSYSRKMISAILERTRLVGMPTRFGSFELRMNTWVLITKPVTKSDGADRPGERAAAMQESDGAPV